MDIYTAHYRYSGTDRLDITVKSATPPGSVLAPTWEMVKRYKDGTLDQWQYTIKYFAKLVDRMYRAGDREQKMLDAILTDRKSLTLVCFCPVGEFCHRILAARMLEDIGYGRYVGERQL